MYVCIHILYACVYVRKVTRINRHSRSCALRKHPSACRSYTSPWVGVHAY